MLELAQSHIYGFEGSQAAKIFMAGFVLVVILAVMLVRMPLIMWMLVSLLLIVAIGAPVNLDRTEYIDTWLAPMQQNRSWIQLAVSGMLTLVVLGTGRMHLARMAPQAWFLFIIALFASMMQTIHEGWQNALQALVFAIVTIPSVALMARSLTASVSGGLLLARAMLVVAALWAGACSVQFMIEPRYLVTSSGRFWGMISNPQLAAMLIGPVLVLALWGMINDPDKRLKVLWTGILCIYILFMGWTGSRLSLVLTGVGWVFVLWSKLGRLAIFLPVIVGLVFGLSFLADELQIGANLDRLGNTDNTRAGAWAIQLEAIKQSPIIGVGWNDIGASENSYIGSWAGFGFAMFLIMVSFLFHGIYFSVKLLLKRRSMSPQDRSLADLVVGFHALYFSGAFFEGYLLGRSSTMQTMMLLFSAMGVGILDRLTTEPESEHAYDEPLLAYPGAYADYAVAPATHAR